MHWKLLFSGVLIFTIHSVAEAQSIYKDTLLGQTVSLVIPKGFCVIPRDHPEGKRFYDLQEQGNQGINRVSVLYSDCKEWEMRVRDGSYIIRNHGNYLFPLTNGREVLVAEAYSRRDAVRSYAMAKDIPSDKIEANVNRRLAEATVNTGRMGAFNIGPIGYDDDAAYIAGTSLVKYPNEQNARALSVSYAMTVLNKVWVQANRYGAYKNDTQLRKQISDTQELIKALVKANP